MKAVYLMFFKLEEGKELEIGALGAISFDPGVYIYAGSAMNSVEKRVERHFSSEKKEHWHVDYFSREAEAFDHFILPEDSEYECVMAEILEKFCEKVPEFGCSDCDCPSHLFQVSKV